MKCTRVKILSSILLLFSTVLAVAEGVQECKDSYRIEESALLCVLKNNSNLFNSFSSVQFSVNCSSSECTILTGPTEDDVKRVEPVWYRIIMKLSDFGSSKKSKVKIQTMYFSPFVDTYVNFKKVKKTDALVLMRKKVIVDTTCLACLVSGLVLFFTAPKLSNSVKFYYTGGVGIGVLASVLIIVFILSRSVPKKPAAYTILLGGWSLCAWILGKIWSNWQILLSQYKLYFLGYIGTAGFLSFALCYWKGPIKDPRTQNIVQWSIQLLALLLLYNSSQAMEVSIALVSSATIAHLTFLCPDFQVMNKVKNFAQKYMWKRKSQPRKLLTEEEYQEEAEVETRKALEELKQFCDSPQCSPWKTMSKIQSPIRFVRFMEGEGHVSDAEMTLHDGDILATDTDSEDMITDDETGDSEVIPNGNKTKIEKNILIDEHMSEDED